VLFIVCTDKCDDAHSLFVRPGPVSVPPFIEQANELPRIVDEFASELRAVRAGFTDADRAGALEHAAMPFAEGNFTNLSY
jgi:hypothetical protein